LNTGTDQARGPKAQGREAKAVTKIFWVTCPQCNGEFYCHWQELRHKKIKLLCPYCSHEFLDEESAKIVE
jgi:hypothetical protein